MSKESVRDSIRDMCLKELIHEESNIYHSTLKGFKGRHYKVILNDAEHIDMIIMDYNVCDYTYRHEVNATFFRNFREILKEHMAPSYKIILPLSCTVLPLF